MGHSRRDKQTTHERIVRVAAKRFRERGLEGIGVADVMKEAGVTVGGFYRHFGSRDELVVEALATAFKDLDVWEEHTADMVHLLQNYLTEAHRDAPGTGCAMGALLGDMTRGSKSARVLYTERVKRTLAFSASLLPSSSRAANWFGEAGIAYRLADYKSIASLFRSGPANCGALAQNNSERDPI